MVTTPVPPIPVTVMPNGPSSTGRTGSGSAGNGLASAVGEGFLSLPPLTLTKLGQKPLRQEKSLLQPDWSIRRLRPSSVSTGWMATQFDCLPQSPQPSQTSSLMTTRSSGSGKAPRLRRRRFSAAQVWS